MKKIFCFLLSTVLILGTFAGCKKQITPSTESTGATQTEITITQQTEVKQTENNKTTQTESTKSTAPDTTEATQPDNTEETESEQEYENPYAIREVTDHRVKIENNQKIYNDDSVFSLTFPVDWKCLIQQGEDGRSHFFRHPELEDKCALTISLTGAEYLYERTPEQYREHLSRSRQDLVIDSITKETIQGYPYTKVVYSYTEDGTKFNIVWYDNVIAGLRMFDLRIIYPADKKDIYEPIFAAMMDSVVLIKYPR